MVKRNADVAKMGANYLFEEIAKRKKALLEKEPGTRLINLGIGDTTELIPQYHVGHHEKLSSFRKTLPANLLAIGSAFEGVGVNDSIALTSQN
ncbi:MAG: LL-diaminopimelate aminotransferase [Chlamydiae bacterium]|nr:LL-diaminopimelate aminotransferase [Chlamydiota bacterium]